MIRLFSRYLKYASLLLAVVSFITVTYWKTTQADTVPTFASQVGQVNSIQSGEHPMVLCYSEAFAFDSNGNMYVADCNSVQKFDASGNLVLRFGEYGSGPGQLGYVTALEVDSQNNLYVSDGGGTNNRIQKFDQNGNFILEWGTAGTGDGQFNNPYGLSVATSGEVYVSDYANNRIQKFDSNGNFLLKFGTLGSGDGQLHGPWGTAVGQNGNVYVVDSVNHRVAEFDPSGNFVANHGSSGSADGQFINPVDVNVDASGTIYVLDGRSQVIQKFDSDWNFIAKYGTYDCSNVTNYTFCYQEGVHVDSLGNIYVNDSGNYRILKYDSNFTYLTKWAALPSGVGDGQFTVPEAVVHDSQGNMYIADSNNNRIQKFDSSGNFVMKFGSSGSGDGQLNRPQGIWVDASSSIYVADSNNNRIQKFDSSGNFVMKFGSSGSGDSQFNDPTSVAVDTSGYIYVADVYNSAIKKFDSNGTFVSKLGTSGSGNGQFNQPVFVTFDTAGYMYVSEYYGDRIQKFDSSGNFVMKFGSEGTGNGQFKGPWAISFDALQNIYIADIFNNRIQKFDASGNFIYKIGGEALTDTSHFNQPYGLDILPNGNLAIADSYNNRVVIWGLPTFQFSSITATSTATSSLITWSTSLEGTSQVEFGVSPSFGSTTAISNTSPKVTAHSVTLGDVPSCSLIHYRVATTDELGATTTSSTYQTITGGCTGNSSITATGTVEASPVATSTFAVGTASIVIPPGFSTSTNATTTFQALKLDTAGFLLSAGTPSGTYSANGDTLHMNAYITATSSLATFTAPIRITLSYDPSITATLAESSLSIYRYDSGTYTLLDNCSVDTSARTVTCTTTHFSDFSIFGTIKPASSGSSVVTSGGGGFFAYNAPALITMGSTTITETPKIFQNLTSSSSVPVVTTPTLFARNLYRGTRGDDVKALQEFLSSFGKVYPEKSVTGYFGHKTYEAIMRFQCELGIVCSGDEVTTGWGVFGPKTRGTVPKS